MTDQTAVAELPGLGHNQPPLGKLIAGEQGDFAAVVTAYLEEEFAKQPQIVAELLTEARDLPDRIEDDETQGKVATLIKKIRDQSKLLDAMHEKEKQPYLRGGQAVDQFFFGQMDKLARRAKTNRAGAADILQARLTDYDTRKLAEEQARRRAEAERQEREAREAREREAEAARKAEEARLAADRARAPAQVEQKSALADQHETEAAVAAAEAERAQVMAEQARVDTYAKPADIMRSRGDDGTLTTMATESYAEVVPGQDGLLDKDKLWPFISLDAKEKALRAWAKTTGYTQQMPGATIGKRPKSVVR